jgi:hypothetical protein
MEVDQPDLGEQLKPFDLRDPIISDVKLFEVHKRLQSLDFLNQVLPETQVLHCETDSSSRCVGDNGEHKMRRWCAESR